MIGLDAGCGENYEEVGRYNMTLEEARTAFLEAVEETGNIVIQEQRRLRKDNSEQIMFTLKEDNDNNWALLEKVACIGETNYGAADLYTLQEVKDAMPGEYVKTGTFG
jgi:hypothetical protein